jgi:hypothetical protein
MATYSNLMMTEDLDHLGFKQGAEYNRVPHPNTIDPKEKRGFIAGLGVKSSSPK